MYCYSNAYNNFFRTIFFNCKQIKTTSQLSRGLQESVWKEAALNEHSITFLPPNGPLYNLWVENLGIEITTTCHGHLLQLLVKPEIQNVSPLALLPSAYENLGIGMHLRGTHTSLHTLKTTVSHPCFLTIVLQVCLSEAVTLICTPPPQRLDQGTDFLSSLFTSWEDLQEAAQGLLATCWGVKHPWWRSPCKGNWGYLPHLCLEGSTISTPPPYREPTCMFL